jgi:uncharacterized sulfatase
MKRLLIATLIVCIATVGRGEERPNFLLIMSDDSTWSDFGFTDNPDVRTPHLDKLAEESIELTRMFTPAPCCSPTRNALFTGLFPVRSGAYPNHTVVKRGTRSVFHYLKDAGYRVGLIGKTHIGPPASYPYETVGGKRALDDFGKTRAFISRDKNQPWMLAYMSNDPHVPLTRGDASQFDPDTIEVPEYLHDNAMTREMLCEYYAEIGKLDDQVGQLMKLLDATGQRNNTVVVFLSEQGSGFPYGGKWSLYDNGIRGATLVRWPGRVEPGSQSDALLQYVDIVPTFLEIAGIDPSGIDTGCPDAFGNTRMDGRSFLNVILGRTNGGRDYVFAEQTTVGINGYLEPYPMRSVRDSRYKYIRNLAPDNTYTIGGIHNSKLLASWKQDAQSDPELAERIEFLYHRPAEELYDTVADPLERNNLAADSALVDVKRRLSQALDAWMKQQMDQGLKTEKLATTRQPRHQRGKTGGTRSSSQSTRD